MCLCQSRVRVVVCNIEGKARNIDSGPTLMERTFKPDVLYQRTSGSIAILMDISTPTNFSRFTLDVVFKDTV